MLSSDDYGKDLASVNALSRKHEAMERDLAALEDKVSLYVQCHIVVPIIFSHPPGLVLVYCMLIGVNWLISGDSPRTAGSSTARKISRK